MTWFYKHPSGDAYYNDVEEGACAWLRELMLAGEIAPGVIDSRSILDVEPTDLIGFTQCHFFAGIGGWSLALRLAGWPESRPVWTGSPPCQPFSVAGRNKGKDDERHLAPKFISLVRACRPRVLFGEQVASSAVFGKAAKGRRGSPASAPEWAWIDDLSDRLEAACYAAWAVDFPSAGINAPHIRQRTYFGAVDTRRLADTERLERQRGWSGETFHEPGTFERPSRLRDAGGLADSERDGQREHGQRLGSASRTGESGTEQRERLRSDATHGRAAHGLADSEGSGWGEERPDRRRGDVGDKPQGQSAGSTTSGFGCGLADSEGVGWPRRGGHVEVGAGSGWGGHGDDCQAGRVVDGVCQGLEGYGGNVDDRREPGRDSPQSSGPAGTASSPCGTDAPHSFWSDADWVYCRDDKWRPIEPGSQPLANGVSGRVGLLRGYGNAINPQQAAVFIEESAQAIAETGPFWVTYETTTDSLEVFG